MTPDDIDRISRKARHAGLAMLELSQQGSVLRLRFDDSRPHAGSVAPQKRPPRGVRAPGVGIFAHGHPVTGRPASQAGQSVRAGQVVGFLTVGGCVRPATAPEDGVIGAPACVDGTLVGYGALLYPIS